MNPISIAAIGFVVTLICTAFFRVVALRFGYTDNPGGRKSHAHPTPVVGGLAMAVGLIVAGFCLPVSFVSYEGLIFGALLLLFVGAVDDILDVSARIRLLTQVVAALAVIIIDGISVNYIGGIFAGAILHLPYVLGFILTLICIVGYINAINMLDGVDGLAGCVVIVQGVFMLFLVIHSAVYIDVYFLSLLLSVLLAFLCFNFPFIGRKQALVFMGDSGSMLLGFVMVWFSLKSSQTAPVIAKPVVFLWIAALPIFEIGYAVLRRLVLGVSPFKPDRKHLHHLLHDRSWNSFSIVLLVILLSFITGLIGIIGQLKALPDVLLFWGFILCFILYSLFMTRLAYRKTEKSKRVIPWP